MHFVPHFQNVAGRRGGKKVNIEINIQHQQKRLRKSLKPPGKKKKSFPRMVIFVCGGVN